MEADEGEEDALIREIREELGVLIRVGQALTPVVHGEVRLMGFFCDAEGEIELREHSALRWLAPDLDVELAWAAADIPIWNEVREFLTSPPKAGT